MTTTEYNIIVDKHADGMYRFALKTIGNAIKAQDIVQDVFEKLWLKKRLRAVREGKVVPVYIGLPYQHRPYKKGKNTATIQRNSR
ncbi:MAG: hypothetical protein HC896_13695 [Bacteroidales bacterium]|nr:hypothetical protein [Bacteroidales bacterium]